MDRREYEDSRVYVGGLKSMKEGDWCAFWMLRPKGIRVCSWVLCVCLSCERVGVYSCCWCMYRVEEEKGKGS